MAVELRADCDKHRIERSPFFFCEDVAHDMIGNDLHAHRFDARDLVHQILARQSVCGDSKRSIPPGNEPES